MRFNLPLIIKIDQYLDLIIKNYYYRADVISLKYYAHLKKKKLTYY